MANKVALRQAVHFPSAQVAQLAATKAESVQVTETFETGAGAASTQVSLVLSVASYLHYFGEAQVTPQASHVFE